MFQIYIEKMSWPYRDTTFFFECSKYLINERMQRTSEKSFSTREEKFLNIPSVHVMFHLLYKHN